VEEPIDFCPWHGGWNGGHSKTGHTNMSVGVDEDIGLDKRERIILRVVEDGRTILRFPWTTLRLWIYFIARATSNT
jgi:hypothetical protein